MRIITEHARTEAKFENVFRLIAKEWENSIIKIVPYKESTEDFILTNSELMAEAIEENITTLTKIS